MYKYILRLKCKGTIHNYLNKELLRLGNTNVNHISIYKGWIRMLKSLDI